MAIDDKTMLSLLAPEYRAYVERLRAEAGPSLDQLSVAGARKRMREMQNADVSSYAVIAERHSVDEFSVLILRPTEISGPLPVIVYYHGGGWVLGDCDTHARMAREIAVQSRAAVAFVEFARAPEAPYPLPLEQCYRALAWVAEHGRSLKIDPMRLAVAGDSAGGTLAVGVSMLAALRSGPEIRLQALLYPVMDCDFTTVSYCDFESGLNLERAGMRWFWDHYLPEQSARTEPLASPLCASLDELRKLPPALVITAECDVLRDEGEAFVRKLARAGVPVTGVRFNGVLHSFMLVDELAQSTQAKSAMRLLGRYVQDAFSKDGESWF